MASRLRVSRQDSRQQTARGFTGWAEAAPGLLTETHFEVTLAFMRAVTIREAKARLNELVEAAARGEQVVLMRGSKHVAAIVPVSAEELELPARLSDPQAEQLWRELAAERRAGSLVDLATPEEAVAHLSAIRPAKRAARVGAAKKRRRPA